MPRPISEIMQTHIDARGKGIRHVGFVIVLNDLSVLTYATGEFVATSVNDDGESILLDPPISFEGRIIESPDFGFVDGRAPDVGEMVIENATKSIGAVIGSGSNPFKGAKITAYTAWERPDGDFEIDPYFVAVVTNSSAEDDNARLTLTSDISDRKAIVGLILGQRCIDNFGGPRCRFPKLPGQECNKVFDDKDAGCLKWRWQHSFVGVPFLVTNPSAGTDGGGIFGGREIPVIGGGGCPSLGQYTWRISSKGNIRTARAIRVDAVKAGDSLYCPANGGIVVVKKTEILDAAEMFDVASRAGFSTIVSASHPFTRSKLDLEGLAAALYQENFPLFSVSDAGQEFDDRLISRESVGKGKVKKIHTTYPYVYGTSSTKDGMIAGHNEKPVYNEY